MKFLMILLMLFTQSAFSQVRYGTRTEEIVSRGFYDWGFLNQDDVGLCGLPMVTRGDNDSLVSHDLIVETMMDHVTETTQRIYLKTDNQFEPEGCSSHKQLVLASINEQGGDLRVNLYYTDKVIINRGSYMGISYCQKEKFRTIEAIIKSVRYFNTTKLSEENCEASTFNP
jgi:hypothetical protein